MNRIAYRVLITGLSAVIMLSAYRVVDYILDMNRTDQVNEMVDELIVESVQRDDSSRSDDKDDMELEFTFTKDSWNALHDQNSDFIGYIAFDSGLIRQPVVQGSDNAYYLSHGFDGTMLSSGTVFLDAGSILSDMNLVLYGHNVYLDQTKMFSPLTTLADQETFDDNRTFTFYLKDEIIRYEIFCIYTFEVSDAEAYDYTRGNFGSAEEFEAWLQYALNRNLVESDIDLKYGDKLITMQTCKKYDDEHRLLVLAKEIYRGAYEE